MIVVIGITVITNLAMSKNSRHTHVSLHIIFTILESLVYYKSADKSNDGFMRRIGHQPLFFLN